MKKLILLFSACCLIAPGLAHAGAWTLPEGSVWIENTNKYSWATKYYDDRGNVYDWGEDTKTTVWSSITKMEYGITDWLTFMTGFEYKEGRSRERAGDDPYDASNHAFTMLETGLRGRLMEDPVVVSAQVKGEWYLSGRGNEDTMELAHGNHTLDLRGLVSKKWDETPVFPFYAGIEAGYRFNNRGLQNHVPLFAEVGFWPLDWLMIKNEFDVMLAHGGTGSVKKSWAIWRIGPTFELAKIYAALRGKDLADLGDTATRAEGRAFDVSVQYGRFVWGRNVFKAQEMIVKAAVQF